MVELREAILRVYEGKKVRWRYEEVMEKVVESGFEEGKVWLEMLRMVAEGVLMPLREGSDVYVLVEEV